MAFANLFTRLCAVHEAVNSPGQPAFPHRNETENGTRRKRTQDEQPGSYKKKKCYRAQTTTPYEAFKEDNAKAIRCRIPSTDGECALVGYTKEVINNHSDKAGHNSRRCRDQNYKTLSNCNVNKKQQREKKMEGQKNQHQRSDRGKNQHQRSGWKHANGNRRPVSRTDRRGRKWENAKQDFQVKPTRFMTQEFKDQNALLVDGRLVCRHFLRGRCNKADDCQLEHIQGYNDLVKEVCKFYIQGFCTKGESCVYMHKSFPCKFFHSKGKCSKGADCRFSHEPLNDVTKQLLAEKIQQENDLSERAKKVEEAASGHPENIEANRTPDILTQPLRPNFYNSTKTNAENEALLCQTEDLADLPPHASDAAQPDRPSSTDCSREEPVCYSVEAMLGPQLSRPLPSFFTAPESQESMSPSVQQSMSDTPLGSVHQHEVPYSVDAVLRSYKSVGNSTFGQGQTPPTIKTVSYSPKTESEEITDPLSSEYRHEKASLNTKDEANKSQEKMFKSLSSHRVHTGLMSQTCPDLSLPSGVHEKQYGDMPESLKTAHAASGQVKLELLHPPVTDVENSVFSKGDIKASMHLPTDAKCSVNWRSQTCLPKHPTQSDSQSSLKPLSPSSGFAAFKDGAAVHVEPVVTSIKTSDSASSGSHHFAAKQRAEIHQRSKKPQSGLSFGTQPHYSAKISPESSSKMANRGDFSVARERPFHSLFATAVTDGVTPAPDSVTAPAYPQHLMQTPPSGRFACKAQHAKTGTEPDKTSATSFLSLFASPLSETAASFPLQSQADSSRTHPCSQQSVKNNFHLSDAKKGAPRSETPLPCQIRPAVTQTSDRPASPKFSSCFKNNNEPVKQPTKQPASPVCSLVSDALSKMPTSPAPCGPNPPTNQAQQQLPDLSSPRGSDVAASANSVLRTLFLCLSPYQEDGEQQDSVQISTEGVFVKQKNFKKAKRKKKHKTRGSHKQSVEKAATHSTEHQASFQPPADSEATGGSTPSSPDVTEPQVGKSGAYNFLFKQQLHQGSIAPDQMGAWR